MNLKNIIALSLLLLLTSCASTNTHQLYGGEPRSQSEVATIESWSESRYSPLGGLFVFPMTIDDIQLKKQKRDGSKTYSYDVLSGKHQVRAYLLWNVMLNMVRIDDPKELTFDAKVGHVYVTKAYTPNEMSEKALIAFWIEDKSSGEVVAGTRPKASE